MIQHFKIREVLLPEIWTVIFAMLFVAPSYKKMRTVFLERIFTDQSKNFFN
jgi:hypothetical protein